MGKHQCENFKTTYFQEHLHTAASEVTLQSDWSFGSGLPTQPSRLDNITKVPVTFKPKL